MISIEASQAYCRAVAKSRAKNFYYSFVLLSPQQKNAMCAVYAFMRYCDDLSDEPGATRAAIDQWREALVQALAGKPDDNPMWLAFLDAVRRYKIPEEYFFDMIEGVASDLEPRVIETFDDLYRYCYRVASVVGLTCVHIFGFEDPAALPLAEKCGIAFQLTNIIRDVKEDTELGRSYIPREDLGRYKDTSELLDFEIKRARAYYHESRPLLDLVHNKSRASLWALIEIYSRLLDKIAKNPMQVLGKRVSLSTAQKLFIAARGVTGFTG